MNSIKLPVGLEHLNDERLATAREATSALTASDLCNIGEPTVVELRDGRRATYYDYPMEDAEGTIFFYQPVNQHMTPQAMAQVYAMQALTNHSVVVFTQNSIDFTKPERKKIRSGNFLPYGEVRLQSIEHALAGRAFEGDVVLAGYSFGATDAAASGVAIAKHNTLEVTTAVMGEAANILQRNIGRLGLDLFSTSAQDLIHAVRAADMPALTELYKINSKGTKSSYLTRDLLMFGINFVKPGNGNINAALGLRQPKFASDVIAMINAMQENGLILIHEDLDSDLTPAGATDDQLEAIKIALAISNPSGVRLMSTKTSTPEEQGHAMGDNPWAWSSIVRSAIDEQKAA